MRKELPVLFSGLAADLMAALAGPAGSTAGAVAGIALSKVLQKRSEAARDILLEELRRGNKVLTDSSDIEETVAVVYRYTRAAREGAARLNLRLMAKVIAGQARLGVLVASEFLYYADMLASLRREEVILLATLQKHRKSPEMQALNEDERDGTVQRLAKADLIPQLFANEDEFAAVAAGATRTGLLIGASGWGTIVYETSPLMDRLEQLAPFRDALNEEP